MQVQPLHSKEHAITMARINEHHSLYGSVINSDTVLWLSWYVGPPLDLTRNVDTEQMPRCRMWMLGPVQWINLIGWRKLQDFEIHAMFIYWREMSVMMGCKWVPYTLAELEDFRKVWLRPFPLSHQKVG